ncbi:hypothetical protein Tempeh6L_11775 [Lactococcus lactis subsp. lactis]|uniref:Uncharacterized protein n=1 Tax=Lactococcus lactis TaxID=1358 RepID=A0A9X4SA98_9LACT|nr:hypothetical protein [Lactococcus lactis]MDG4984769.1 hypothetical protein [Lactococcus lactis]
MNFDFTENQEQAMNEEKVAEVEIAPLDKKVVQSPESTPERFDFFEFIEEERRNTLEEEKMRHNNTINDINMLFDKMRELETEKADKVKNANKKVNKMLNDIKTLISEHATNIEDEVRSVATEFQEKADKIKGELTNE